MTLAAPARRMPTAQQLGDVLSDLLDRQVITELQTTELGTDDPTGIVCGVLLDEAGHVGGACIAEAGAAAMIPRAVADEAAATGELDATLSDNFAEVVNILTGIVNTPIHDHLRMSGLEAGVPDPVKDLLIKANGRATYLIDVADYGTGRIALYAR
jgi:predicted ATPase with chaperone activity